MRMRDVVIESASRNHLVHEYRLTQIVEDEAAYTDDEEYDEPPENEIIFVEP